MSSAYGSSTVYCAECGRPSAPEELARWTKLAGEPIWNEWVKRMEAKGHKEARDILNATIDSLKN